MGRKRSIIFPLMAVALGTSASATLAAQADDSLDAPLPRIVVVPGRGNVLVQPYVTDDPKALPRTVIVPGRGEVYVVPVRPRDKRTDRQRCVDKETAAIGGSRTPLDDAAIDLKCSQR